MLPAERIARLSPTLMLPPMGYWTVVVERGIPGQTQITEHQITRVGSKLSRARRDVDRSRGAVQVGQKRSGACIQVYLASGDAAPRKRKNSVGFQLRAADVKSPV